MEISSRESFVLTPGGRNKPLKVVGEAKTKINQQKHRKWGTEQRNIKMLRSMTKKKQKTRKSKSIKIHMTAVDMVNCEPHRTRAEQNANMFLN